MDNLLGQDFINIERIYDLKGSTKGRIVKLSDTEEKEQSGLKVLKDLNFLKIGEKLDTENFKRQELFDVIDNDLSFLRANRLMDYSLLFIKVKNSQQ